MVGFMLRSLAGYAIPKMDILTGSNEACGLVANAVVKNPVPLHEQ